MVVLVVLVLLSVVVMLVDQHAESGIVHHRSSTSLNAIENTRVVCGTVAAVMVGLTSLN